MQAIYIANNKTQTEKKHLKHANTGSSETRLKRMAHLNVLSLLIPSKAAGLITICKL